MEEQGVGLRFCKKRRRTRGLMRRLAVVSLPARWRWVADREEIGSPLDG